MPRKTNKPKTIKIEVKERGEEIPVRVEKHMEVNEAVNKLYSEMSEKDIKNMIKALKKIWKAERREKYHKLKISKYQMRKYELMKGEK